MKRSMKRNESNSGFLLLCLLALLMPFLPLIGLCLMAKEDNRKLGMVLFAVGIILYILAYK